MMTTSAGTFPNTRFGHWISPQTQSVSLGPFELESGALLSDVRLAFRTWGRLAADRSNVVLVCHALTGSADVDRWWGDLLGPGRALDPERDYVVCSNVLGGCYGSTGPAVGPDDAGAFPPVTIRDMVRAQTLLMDRLDVRSLRLVIGGSLGGMQVLEWAATFPERVEALAPIAVSARHSPWCIALSAAQRRAIASDLSSHLDPAWRWRAPSRCAATAAPPASASGSATGATRRATPAVRRIGSPSKAGWNTTAKRWSTASTPPATSR